MRTLLKICAAGLATIWLISFYYRDQISERTIQLIKPNKTSFGIEGLFNHIEECVCNQSIPPLGKRSDNCNSKDHNLAANTSISDILEHNLQWMSRLIDPRYNVTAVRNIQLKRFSLINKICLERSPRSYRIFRGRVRYLSYRNTTWNVMPKTGSTNLLRIICIIIGPKCTSITGYRDEHDYVPSFLKELIDKDLFNYTTFERELQDSPYFTYVIVRDPWHRLVSTYIEKVVQSDRYKNFCQEGGNAAFAAYLQKKAALNESELTFPEFLQHCVRAQYDVGGAVTMQEHWRPQSIGGAFCDINYNFIGKTETYNEDIKAILHQFKVPNISGILNKAKKHRRSNEKSNLTSTSYLDSWKSVDKEMIDKLRQIYSIDLAMFDYSHTPL